jgi:protein tyrosine phosphatase
MHLIRSPSLLFALLFSIFSISLSILTFNIGNNHTKHHIQLLIILPPLNSIFLFLTSLTWTERRFRLSYIPFICLIILLFSSLTLTIISSLFFSLSIILYINFIFYFFFTILFLSLLLIIVISYLYGSSYIHRYRHMMTIEQQNNQLIKTNDIFQIDKLILKANINDEFILFMSILPGRRIRDDIRNITDDLNQINVDTILTLNETKEFSFMNMTNKNPYDMDIYSMHIKRACMEHIVYPIRDHFIPKSISDYIQFLYSIVINLNRLNRNRLLIHCMGGMGRTGMTVVCFELIYEYIMNENEQETKQNLIERFFHYPFLLEKSCRVCQAIGNVRKARPGTIPNALQVLFVHELYARLKSPSYMEQIKNIISLNEKLLSDHFNELHLAINT